MTETTNDAAGDGLILIVGPEGQGTQAVNRLLRHRLLGKPDDMDVPIHYIDTTVLGDLPLGELETIRQFFNRRNRALAKGDLCVRRRDLLKAFSRPGVLRRDVIALVEQYMAGADIPPLYEAEVVKERFGKQAFRVWSRKLKHRRNRPNRITLI